MKRIIYFTFSIIALTIPVIVIHLINPWVADVISDAAKDWLGAIPFGMWMLLSVIFICKTLIQLNEPTK